MTTSPPAKAKTSNYLATILSFTDQFSKVSQDPTMGLQQLRILLALYVHGTLNQSDLTTYAQVAKQSISRHLKVLGGGSFNEPGRGYIETERDRVDTRHVLVSLTALGRSVLEESVKKTEKFV